MANSEGKGSILLKIVIVLLIIVTILVIKIPNDIWKKEARIQEQCRDNITSIYDAYTYYYHVHGEFIQDKDQLIASIQNDSTLMKRHKIVSYTKRLLEATELFMHIPLITDLQGIHSNFLDIVDDISANDRYFKGYSEIDDLAQNIMRSLSGINLGSEYEKYRIVSAALDTLWQVRLNLSDYPLQVAAMHLSLLADKAASNVGVVNFSDLENLWKPINDNITVLIKKINSEEQLRVQTNIVYQLSDFQDKINGIFSNRKNYDFNTNVQLAESGKENIKQVYQEFLSDFLITENVAQFRLSDEDSLLINLSESNFYTPSGQKPYIITLMDSGAVSVEDPTLLPELQQKASVPIEKMNNLPFLAPIKSVFSVLDSILVLNDQVQKAYRRNTELSQHCIEIKFTTTLEINDLGEVKNFKNLIQALDALENNNSFYGITKYLDMALVSIHQIDQRYQQNLFRLDTVYTGLLAHITAVDSILKTIRRNQYSMEPLMTQLENNYAQYKNVSASDVNAQVISIKQDIEDILQFAAEGSSIPVYTIFSQKVQNHGRMYGRTGEKSWEEER